MKIKSPIINRTSSHAMLPNENLDFGMLAITLRGGIVEFVEENDIVYCKACGNSTLLYLDNGKILETPKLLKKVLGTLSKNNFQRIHNSYAINLSFAKQFIKKNSGGQLKLRNGELLPVSEKHKKEVLSLFKIV